MEQFTGREKEVAELLLQGKSNKQIALALYISKSTVEFHLKNIYQKLGAASRTEAALLLSKSDLSESTGQEQKGDLRQSAGDESVQPEYSSQAKHFFDPKEEKTMKNRTLISMILSAAAVVITIGICAYSVRVRGENHIADSSSQLTSTSNIEIIPENTPQGDLQVSSEASTRNYDEVLLYLRTPIVPFHYAAVFVAVGCLMPGGQNCAFTEKIPFSDGESPTSPVYWMPDGENGFYSSNSEILVLNHLERQNAKSDTLVSNLLITDSAVHLSPDARWLVQSVQVDDPYASDLVLIKTLSGNSVKLDIGLNTCFKTPIGWLTSSKFLFRCDISTGATSKKILSEVHYYTYDALSQELLEFKNGMKTVIGFDAISPNGEYIAFAEKQYKDLPSGNIQIQDLSNNKIYPLNFQDGQIVWSHDSSRMAIFRNNGDIYISNFDGSDQRKIFSSGWQGYLSMEWFPDDKYIALIGSSNENENKTQMIIVSTNGKVVNYEPIPTTDGYDIVGISSLPAIKK